MRLHIHCYHSLVVWNEASLIPRPPSGMRLEQGCMAVLCSCCPLYSLSFVPESRAMTITTFAKDRLQHLQNSSNSPHDEYELVEEKSYFTQGPEYVVIKVYLQATPIPSRDMGKLDADVLHFHGCIRLEGFGTPHPLPHPPFPTSLSPLLPPIYSSPLTPTSTLLLIPPPPHPSSFPSPSFQIDHAVVASVFTDSRGRETLAASHRQLKGYLVDVDGDVIRELSPDPGKPDKAGLF